MESTALADPPSVTALLKPGFTALSNGLIDSGLLAKLTRIELALFLVLCRFSTGFLRLQATIGEQKLCELTGASPASLYEAKKGLVGHGLITISHTKTGRCLYQLAKWLQPILTRGEAIEPPIKPVWAKTLHSAGVDPSTQLESYKEFKEIQNQHIAQPQPLSTDDELLQSDIKHLAAVPASKPVDASLGLLVSRLRHLGVNEFMAHKLAKSASEKVIENALERVKTIQTTNPAGYLVSEISRGGYQEKPDPNKAQREFHREIHEKRQKERELTAQANQAAELRAEQLMQLYRDLPSVRQTELTEQVRQQAQSEGFTRIPGWGEGHPAWRGLLIEALSKVTISSG